jgi:uncharacterized protein YukE
MVDAVDEMTNSAVPELQTAAQTANSDLGTSSESVPSASVRGPSSDITAASTEGQVQALVSELDSELNDVSRSLSGVSKRLLNLTVAGWQSNTTLLQPFVQKISSADAELNEAWASAQQLLNLLGSTSTNSSSNELGRSASGATTGFPGSAPSAGTSQTVPTGPGPAVPGNSALYGNSGPASTSQTNPSLPQTGG